MKTIERENRFQVFNCHFEKKSFGPLVASRLPTLASHIWVTQLVKGSKVAARSNDAVIEVNSFLSSQQIIRCKI